MREGDLLRAWVFAVLGVSILVLSFMLYLIPLTPLVPQRFSDRETVSLIAFLLFGTGIVGFALVSMRDPPARKIDLLKLGGLQALAAVVALFAAGSVYFGR